MRLLVLGGTVFVGRAVAAEAVRRGHDVVCAARGESGQVPAGARLVPVDRDAEDGLAALESERFDAVVDVAPLSYPWVDRALRAFAEHARHWSFVSTLNVYADTATRGQTPATGPLVESLAQHATSEEMKALGSAGADLYGGIKVASENAVRQAMGDHAFITRPGLITGPGDRSDRFGYWPARFARGGRVVVPDVPTQPIQFIDVRDYAEWLVAAAEQDITGTFDAVGPHQPLPDMLEQIAAAVGTAGGKPAELVPVTVEQLHSAGVNPWAGPRSLPLWLPPEYDGMKSHDPAPSRAAGLPVRPLADTVSAALAHERELGVDRERKAGLTLTEEQNILLGL